MKMSEQIEKKRRIKLEQREQRENSAFSRKRMPQPESSDETLCPPSMDKIREQQIKELFHSKEPREYSAKLK